MTQQLERRDPTQEDEDEDEDMGDEESSEEDSDSESDDDEGENEDEEGEGEEPDLELRSKIEEALRASGIEPADDSEGDSEEDEVMDDDQMMAIDDQLAEIFRSRAGEKKGGKGGEPPTPLLFIRVDLQLLQMPTPNVRPLISRTAFSTSWISTSRNNRPAPTSRF